MNNKFLKNYEVPTTSIPYKLALEKAKKYFDGSQIEAEVFLDKYALKGPNGAFFESTPDEMHVRLAKQFHRIEQNYSNPIPYSIILNSLNRFKYLVPQGSPMAGIGNPFQVMSISNCFVTGNDSDSYSGIMRTDEQLVHLMKRRAGVGTDISHLRPSESPVNNTARTSTGAVSFMSRYSNTTREVAQSGRRGALMISISGLHPDVESFIDIKMDETSVTGANISVRQFDEFMQAVNRGDKEFTLRFPVDVKPEDATFTRNVSPVNLWNKIVKNAWSRAEPGILFWDTIIKESLPDCYKSFGFKTFSTNPCGEIPLCISDSCRLLAINLINFVINPFTPDAYFDWDLFKTQINLGQRLMDDMIDLELEHIEAILEKIKNDPEDDDIKKTEATLWEGIKKKAEQGRRTGLGITAMGDMLAALGLRYGSPEGIDFSEKIMQTKKLVEYKTSVILAEERGPFPIWNWNLEKENPFLLRIKQENPELYNRMSKSGRRNIAISTIAPAGTVSVMTQTSSGIENVFSIAYFRMKKINPNDKNARVDFVDETGDSWQEYPVFHPQFEKYLMVNGLTKEAIINLTKEEVDTWFEKSPYYKATANDVDWVKKVEMQGRIQKHVDHSISVTVNLPKEATVETVHKVYMTAWKSGCKGITIYREGSRTGVLNTTSKKDTDNKIIHNNAPKRPKSLPCDVYHVTAMGDPWTVAVGLLSDEPYEVFAVKNHKLKHKSKATLTRIKRGHYNLVDLGGNTCKDFTGGNTDEEATLTRLISTALRHGAKIEFIIEQLNKSEGSIVSFSKAIARSLKKYIKDENLISTDKTLICPRDGTECTPVFIEGCLTCATCGTSKCS